MSVDLTVNVLVPGVAVLTVAVWVGVLETPAVEVLKVVPQVATPDSVSLHE